MLRIGNRYIIGTHIMFYEIEMVKEHVQSLVNAINEVDMEDRKKITIELFYNISEYFEKVDTSQISKEKLIEKFKDEVKKLKDTGCSVQYKVYDENKPYTMVDYRRDLNYNNCVNNDYVIWGESDSLMPKETFEVLESIKNYANQNKISRLNNFYRLVAECELTYRVRILVCYKV